MITLFLWRISLCLVNTPFSLIREHSAKPRDVCLLGARLDFADRSRITERMLGTYTRTPDHATVIICFEKSTMHSNVPAQATPFSNGIQITVPFSNGLFYVITLCITAEALTNNNSCLDFFRAQ